MRQLPWSLVFLAASITTLAGLALWPQPVAGGPSQELSPGPLLVAVQPLQAANQATAPPSVERELIPQGLQILLRVEDQHGQPIRDVEIHCDRVSKSSIGRVAEGHTDASGEFASTYLKPGHFEVSLVSAQYLQVPPITLHLPVDGGVRQTIRLQRGSVVSGKLDGTDGAPRNHGLLLLQEAAGEAVLVTKPDVHGNFLFPAVAEGPWQLSWHANKNTAPDPRLQHTLACAPGEDHQLLVTIQAADLRMLNDNENHRVGVRAVPQN